MAIETLQELIRIPSYSGHESNAQEFIKSYLVRSGVEPYFRDENLLVHLKGADSTKAFIFNSHTDVVDIGDSSKWKHNPWSGDICNGRIFGRGASDMKSGVYASMETAKILAQKNQLPCDVWFTYVVQEETDGTGTKSFVQQFVDEKWKTRYSQIAAIFTEPTSLTTIQYGHRGNFFIKASIDGEAAHSSRPDKIGIHAIMRMVAFIQELDLERIKWSEYFKQCEFIPPSVTPTSFEARSASCNKTSDRCEAVLDLRTIPSFHKEAYGEVVRIAGRHGVEISLMFPETPAGYTKPDAKIVKAIRQAVPSASLGIFGGAADMGFLTEIGVEGAIFGPGEMEQAHKTDESAKVDDVIYACEIFPRIYFNWASME